MDNMIFIKDGKIYFPKTYFRGNGSMIHFSPTNFITPLGILFPLDFYSFALNDYLQGGIKAVRTVDIPLRGIVLGTGKTIYEVIVNKSSDGTPDIETMTPMQYEPDVKYGKGSNQILDMLIGIGLEENCDGVDMLIAGAKISRLNRHHYNIMPVKGYFEVIDRMTAMRKRGAASK